MGLQGKSQLEKRYGQDAEAMLSQPATKIFLKTSEPRAARWGSDAIGEIEVERLKESRSMELIGSKQSFAMDIATKPLIMPSEIAGLAPLRGYIKQENRVVPACFELAKKKTMQPEFVHRQHQTVPAKAMAEPSAISAKPAPPNSLARKHEASHAVEATTRQEAFQWDSNEEIE